MKYSKLKLLEILQNTPREGWTVQKIKDLIDSLWRDPSAGSNTSVQNFELELARKSTGGSYMELTYTNGLITREDYWADSSKLVKLFTKTITYSGSNPLQVVVTDEQTGKIMQTIYAYTGNLLTSVIKTIS